MQTIFHPAGVLALTFAWFLRALGDAFFNSAGSAVFVKLTRGKQGLDRVHGTGMYALAYKYGRMGLVMYVCQYVLGFTREAVWKTGFHHAESILLFSGRIIPTIPADGLAMCRPDGMYRKSYVCQISILHIEMAQMTRRNSAVLTMKACQSSCLSLDWTCRANVAN